MNKDHEASTSMSQRYLDIQYARNNQEKEAIVAKDRSSGAEL